MLDPVLEQILRSGLALLFAIAALHKAQDFAAFRSALGAYDLLPARAVGAAARALVGAEVAVAAALLLAPPPARAGTAGLAAGLLALYGAAIAVNLLRGRRAIDCGCTGPALRQPLHEGLVARNALLAGGALLCLLPTAARPLLWVDAVTAMGATAVLAALYAASNRLLAARAALAPLDAPGDRP